MRVARTEIDLPIKMKTFCLLVLLLGLIVCESESHPRNAKSRKHHLVESWDNSTIHQVNSALC